MILELFDFCFYSESFNQSIYSGFDELYPPHNRTFSNGIDCFEGNFVLKVMKHC